MSTSDPSPPLPGASESTRLLVLLVEDVDVVRRGLAVSLVADPTVRLIGAPRTVAEAYELMRERLPDVVVVGTSPAEVSALEAVRGLRRRFSGVGVILVSAQPTDDELFAAIQAGAAAYLDLSIDLPTIQATVRRVAAGEYVINELLFDREDAAAWVRARFRSESSRAPSRSYGIASLTDREREVLRELGAGALVDELEAVLGARTVRRLLRSIARKLAEDAGDERDDPLKSGVPVRPPGPWSPPGHLRAAVPLPGTEQKR
jgi:DNA-binding NarL/FixJ family response regulator